MRIIAVDWSGATRTAHRHIWLAEASPSGQLIRLECGRDRAELTNHVLNVPPNDLVVGFDFAFSFPAWFVQELGVSCAPDLWALVAEHAEQWLTTCEPPFWGRPGKPCPMQTRPRLRCTDASVPRTNGIAPKSVFQVGGAGAVGTGSLRGMPTLSALHNAGARIWPFTDHGWPLVLEIYPRLFTGPVRKSDATARAALLATRYPTLNNEMRRAAIDSED